ncbi:MAG: DUF4384 domain-containing protein, partial [Gammaproteobacteria bacterium]|nr:DUF4384 domain-containing protein [Gammaproteobacteria bacterium]
MGPGFRFRGPRPPAGGRVRTMRFARLATGPVFGLTLLCAAPMAAQEQFAARDEPLESRIWLDRGTSPVLRRGDLVRVFYRASRDAYVSIFHIDTNGFTRLLHPGSPTDGHLALAGRDYRLLFPESRYWQVEEDEGKGYLFMVASPAPLDFSGFAYSRYEGGWNLAALAQAAYRDPFLMMDDVVAALIPEEAGEYALDFVAYDIDRPHDYPRFLCYQCHGFRPMFDWNPYGRWCTDFRVVIHDDPYYYPVYRYSGDRVVYTRPPEPSRPMFEFKERVDGEAATPLIRTRSGDAAERGVGRDLGQGPGEVPTARVPGLREPMLTGTGAQAGLARPADGPALPGRVVRPRTMAVPSGSVGLSADARGQAPPETRATGAELAPVGQRTAAAGEVRAEGADPVASPETVGDAVVGAPPAVPLPATSPRPDGSLPDAAVRGARLRPGTTPLPEARAAEGRDERPVLQRRGEPPPGGSAPPPSARPGTPPGDPPPPSAGRPPPDARSGPPTRSSGRPPPA